MLELVLREAAEADDAEQPAVLRHRQVPEIALEHHLGGFLDEAFRAHDYQLGRRNCQKFLRDIFSVGEGHPFVEAWPPGVAKEFCYLDEQTWKVYFPVIPLVGTAALEVPAPEWPRIGEERLAEIEYESQPDAIQRRAALIGSLNPSGVREAIGQQLERERVRINKQLELLGASHTRLEASVASADAEVERLRQRVEAADQAQQSLPTPGTENTNGASTAVTPQPTPTPAQPPLE